MISEVRRPAMHLGDRGVWVMGGLATALLLLALVGGDAYASNRPVSDPEAMRLLSEAGGAVGRTSYQGTQFVNTGAETFQVTTQHPPGGGSAVARTRGSALSDERSTYVPAAGLNGFTSKMLEMLARNYSVVRGADDHKCGRSARVVEARRSDGTTAGRFWIDRDSGLMLHREVIDESGRTIGSSGFYDVRISPSREDVRLLAQTSPAQWGGQLTGRELKALRDQGWPIPDRLPGGLTRYEARRSTTDKLLHLGYTDGLSVVSVFVQPGRLDERRFAGWRRTSEGGRTVYHQDKPQRWAVWAGRGYVHTVVTEAPLDTADHVVASLPDGRPGLWARLERGGSRVGSWVNPFN